MTVKSLDELLDGPQFVLSYTEKRDSLLPRLLDRANRCAAANPALASYHRQMGFAADAVTDYDQLPYLPVSMFKEFDLATVPPDQVVRTLLSSATTGAEPSRIPLDKVTGKNQTRGLAAILKDQLGSKRRPFLVLDVPGINQPGLQLSARGAAVRGIMPFASETTYALKQEGVGFALDSEALEQFFLRHLGKEVLVFGFTYLVWTEVVQELRRIGEKFNHPQMILLHSGGWKKLTGQQVDKEVFAAGVGEVFGCAADRVRDFYGMVEQVGVVFVDCEAGHKHSPTFAEVAIRDLSTLRQVEVGGTGLIQVMSLLPESYPGYALITEDVGQLLGYDDCPCGRPGMYFRFRSRVHQAEVRGCGDTVAVSRTRVAVVSDQPVELTPVSDQVTHLGGAAPLTGDDPLAVFRELRVRLEEPPALPLAAVKGLLDDAADRLIDPALAGIEGLAFLAAWLKRRNLDRVLETNFGHRQAALEGPVADGGSAITAAPRGLVGHWVAGNVPTLAVFSWALAVLSGNASILRVSADSRQSGGLLFGAVARARYVHDGRELTGADLLARTSVLHFASAHRGLNEAMSLVCDARSIWGGAEAVNAVRGLPTVEHGEDLVFGPKFSLAVVDRRRLADPQEADNLARSLAREMAVFDQSACSSPQILFLEGTLEEHESWLEQLHQALAVVQGKSTRRFVSETAAAEVIRLRGRYGLSPGSWVWASKGTEHTLLAASGSRLVEAVQGRTLFVQAVTDLREVLPLLSPKIQTLGLGMAEGELRDGFCAAAARRGVSRCVPLGAMNFFDAPWDGMLPLDRLVRWVRVLAPAPEAGQ